jgi:hypothetical protein
MRYGSSHVAGTTKIVQGTRRMASTILADDLTHDSYYRVAGERLA